MTNTDSLARVVAEMRSSAEGLDRFPTRQDIYDWADRLAALRAQADAAAPHPQAAHLSQPIAWESTTIAFTKYITEEQYRNFAPEVRKWYKPYRCSECLTAQGRDDLDAMISRFLSWKLPDTVCPDGIYPVSRWREHSPCPELTGIGTNLLNAAEARAMLEHVLAAKPSSKAGEGGENG